MTPSQGEKDKNLGCEFTWKKEFWVVSPSCADSRWENHSGCGPGLNLEFGDRKAKLLGQAQASSVMGFSSKSILLKEGNWGTAKDSSQFGSASVPKTLEQCFQGVCLLKSKVFHSFLDLFQAWTLIEKLLKTNKSTEKPMEKLPRALFRMIPRSGNVTAPALEFSSGWVILIQAYCSSGNSSWSEPLWFPDLIQGYCALFLGKAPW